MFGICEKRRNAGKPVLAAPILNNVAVSAMAAAARLAQKQTAKVLVSETN